jgi:hypothetical protein
MIATKIRVEVFEILKQRSKSAMKNNTILSMEKGFHKCEPTAKARDHVRPHKQRPGKAEINGHRFKTKDSASTSIKICQLPARVLLRHTHQMRLSTHCVCSFFFVPGTVDTN